MKVLIDIGHPAHVHLLKHLSDELKQRGHLVYYSVRDIPVAKRLMDCYGMTPYVDLGGKKDSLLGKAQTVIHQDGKLLRFVRNNHIDFGLSSGIVLSHVSKLTGMKSIMRALMNLLICTRTVLLLSPLYLKKQDFKWENASLSCVL